MPPQHKFVRARSMVPGIAAVYGYEIDGQPAGVHLGMPSGSVTIVISLDGPVKLADDADRWQRGETREHDALVAGLHTRPTYILRPVRQRGIQLAVHPLAARRLLGMPTGGAVPIAELARETSLSQRQLSALINRELGVGAKRLARLMRFDLAITAIGAQVRAGRTPVLADVASRCGYYDQSHLAREFQHLADRPPSRYLAEEFQNIQAGGHQPPSRIITMSTQGKTPEPTSPAPTIWPTLQARDARALIDWLVATFGFEETAVHEDGGKIAHAQLDWPEGGGIMLGDHKPDGEWSLPSGAFGAYVVTDHVDALYERARAAGARIIRHVADQDYGNREFAVADPEGNLWSFGPYRGEPRA